MRQAEAIKTFFSLVAPERRSVRVAPAFFATVPAGNRGPEGERRG